MKNPSLKYLLVVLMVLQSSQLFAQDEAKKEKDLLFKSLEYPELQVVPRASERVFMEAKAEQQAGFLSHWPLQLPAILTLYSGLTSGDSYRDNDPNPSDYAKERSEYAALTATSIGAGWLVGSVLLSMMNPYQRGLSEIKKVKAKDRRGELLQERLAEETLQRQADLIRTLTLLSVSSNLLANAWVAAESSEMEETIAIIGVGMSLIPLFFPHRHRTAYDKHLEYKRKIYSPISSINFVPNNETSKLDPQWTLSWSF